MLTGDKGEIDDMGRLKITGRIKEIFKTSKGKYVAPAPIENKIISHDEIEMVCVAGAECPQPHALIHLSEEAFPKRDDPEFRKHLEESLEGLMKSVNATVDPHEALQFMVVVKDTWGMDNGFLTPTMKIKRDVVEKTYSDHIDTWYGARKKVIWE